LLILIAKRKEKDNRNNETKYEQRVDNNVDKQKIIEEVRTYKNEEQERKHTEIGNRKK
jgi:hypothetical protein